MPAWSVRFPGNQDAPVTLYARLTPDPILAGAQLTFWVEQGDGDYLQARGQRDQVTALQAWLDTFNAHLHDLDREMLAGGPDPRSRKMTHRTY